MALKTAFLLLTVVLAVRATNVDENDPLHQKLNGDLNSVCNELLGVPCKTSPPPPSPGTPLTTPPSEPPTEPPSVPAPGPEAIGDGIATGVIELSLPDGVSLSPAQRQALYDLLQAQISGNGEITPTIVGRKLLAIDTLLFTVTKVLSCSELVELLDTYIQSGQYANAANAEDIPVLVATLINIQCSGANAGFATETNVAPPSLAPAPSPARR